MENPKQYRLTLSIDERTNELILKLKHAIEHDEKKRITVSELFRRAMAELDKSVSVPA